MNQINRNIILLSGGVGSRFGTEMPKQYYRSSNGDTILKKSMSNFNPDYFDNLVVVCDQKYNNLIRDELQSLGFKKIHLVRNGSTRHQSIVHGIKKLESLNVIGESHIFLQESVRPFVTKGMMDELMAFNPDSKNVSPGINPIVLYSRLTNGKAHKLIEKNNLVELQLPKRYHMNALSNLLPKNIEGEQVLDESQFLIEAGIDVDITKGSRGNIKVTFIEDKEYL